MPESLRHRARCRQWRQPADAPKRSPVFENLIRSLGQNAAMLLGGYADPRTGQPVLDLEGAREMIDMLDVLREKTRGNLAPEEDTLLMDVLGNLKLAFMEMAKAGREAREGPVPALIEDPPCLQHLIPYSNLRCLVPARPWECRRSRAIAACALPTIRATSGCGLRFCWSMTGRRR